MRRSRTGGASVTAQELYQVAQIMASEIGSGKNVRISDVIEVYSFLITTRANFRRWDAQVQEGWDPSKTPKPPTVPSVLFDRLIEGISTYLGEQIPVSGNGFKSPFSGQLTTGKRLRDELYQRTQHNGHPGAALAFA